VSATTPAKAGRVNRQASAVAELLKSRGHEIDPAKPPTVDQLRSETTEVRWTGRDYDPSKYVYCRASTHDQHLPALDRMVARGYVPCPGDVALDGCYGGPNDVIMYADRDATETRAAGRLEARRALRGEVEDPTGAKRQSTRRYLTKKDEKE